MTEFHWSGASPVGPGHSIWERIPETNRRGYQNYISQGPYRIPDRLKDGVKRKINTLQEDGIIEHSDSTWCSPCVPVVKPNGQV